MLPANTSWDVPLLPSSSLTVRMCVKDRASILNDILRKPPVAERERTRRFVRNRLVMRIEGRIVLLNAVDRHGFGTTGRDGKEPAMLFKGYRILKPNSINIINPDIHYFTGRDERLRPQQCMMLQTVGLGDLDQFVLHEYPLMAFYGNLSRAHRDALFTRAGLDAARLRSDDQERLRCWFAMQDSDSTGPNVGDVVRALRVFAVVEANGTRFRAVIQRADGAIEAIREQIVSALPRTAKRDKPKNKKASAG